jgi:hypothetical protein
LGRLRQYNTFIISVNSVLGNVPHGKPMPWRDSLGGSHFRMNPGGRGDRTHLPSHRVPVSVVNQLMEFEAIKQDRSLRW